MASDLQPGDYAKANRALADLAEALGTMSYPLPDGRDEPIGKMFQSVLGTVASSIAAHERAYTAQEQLRPVAAMVRHDGKVLIGSISDDGTFHER